MSILLNKRFTFLQFSPSLEAALLKEWTGLFIFFIFNVVVFSDVCPCGIQETGNGSALVGKLGNFGVVNGALTCFRMVYIEMELALVALVSLALGNVSLKLLECSYEIIQWTLGLLLLS